MSESVVIVTGASSGIGEGFAGALAREGKKLLLVARRADRLEALQAKLGHLTAVHILPLDLSLPDSMERLVVHCKEKDFEIAGIINNAGVGLQGSLCRMPVERVEGMIDVNIRTLTKITWAFLPGMMKRGQGFIMNVASTAAFQPVPYFAVYAATKAYVVSFSEAVYEEARRHGVQVCALCPGPASTEFQQVAGMEDRFFAHSQSVEEVVAAGMKLLRSGDPLGWTSLFQRTSSLGASLLPRAVVRRLAATLLRWAGAE